MSWRIRIFFLVLFICATGNVARAQCEEAKSTLQINECFAKELKKADVEFNSVYRSIVDKLQPDDTVRLRKAPRAWLGYRNAQCEAEHAPWGGGHGRPSGMDEF
jgi:uncharacterized protein YecT (DUF1311 family)